ncbi:MAG: aminotransferase class III-fold pyridoxal phosphate-dependent enzyme [Flavobacteriales bacterium]|nr:aminotransferase class III-fold pyridoxal phosphate-dependent enzyme [Flavobacteriales bacterium]
MERNEINKSLEELERAKAIIPGGVLGIRRPYNFVEGEYPVFIESGKGCHITDVDGNEYIDFLCGYGPIILGYRDTEVDNAVVDQIQNKGFCFSLTQTLQNDLAEKLNEIIPCAEMSLFVKTGSDATTTAVRIARGYTDRTKIIRCGYHGWHDWCVEVKGGIPEKLYEDTLEFGYNNLEGLKNLLASHGDDVAAVIITPFGHPLAAEMEEPKEGFLEGVKELAQKYGAVLIFDEIRTGFRLSMGGAQEYYNVIPDMAVFGKAMANGYSIGAITGSASVMKTAESKVFVSSTFFPNSLAVVAALKTIEILQRDNVLDAIWEKGTKYMGEIESILKRYPEVQAKITGVGPMSFITFSKDEEKKYKLRRTLFYTELIRRNVFMQPFHHGYIMRDHTEEDLCLTIGAVRESIYLVNSSFS